jgi:hypothetical protein
MAGLNPTKIPKSLAAPAWPSLNRAAQTTIGGDATILKSKISKIIKMQL